MGSLVETHRLADSCLRAYFLAPARTVENCCGHFRLARCVYVLIPHKTSTNGQLDLGQPAEDSMSYFAEVTHFLETLHLMSMTSNSQYSEQLSSVSRAASFLCRGRSTVSPLAPTPYLCY
uniref:Uncharacterized protein n=1 Tax=Rhodosorus marinus TaxID=101924 RepID=A0A7S2ZNE1_9RHOD